MTSGIYIMTNKQTGKRYVGYSEDIEMRLTENMRQLQAKTFGEAYRDLISDYQKYGETAFICGILEVTCNTGGLLAQVSALRSRVFAVANFCR